jgi:hypothetical protein
VAEARALPGQATGPHPPIDTAPQTTTSSDSPRLSTPVRVPPSPTESGSIEEEDSESSEGTSGRLRPDLGIQMSLEIHSKLTEPAGKAGSGRSSRSQEAGKGAKGEAKPIIQIQQTIACGCVGELRAMKDTRRALAQLVLYLSTANYVSGTNLGFVIVGVSFGRIVIDEDDPNHLIFERTSSESSALSPEAQNSLLDLLREPPASLMELLPHSFGEQEYDDEYCIALRRLVKLNEDTINRLFVLVQKGYQQLLRLDPRGEDGTFRIASSTSDVQTLQGDLSQNIKVNTDDPQTKMAVPEVNHRKRYYKPLDDGDYTEDLPSKRSYLYEAGDEIRNSENANEAYHDNDRGGTSSFLLPNIMASADQLICIGGNTSLDTLDEYLAHLWGDAKYLDWAATVKVTLCTPIEMDKRVADVATKPSSTLTQLGLPRHSTPVDLSKQGLTGLTSDTASTPFTGPERY